jgi:hypothetical protein
MADIESLRRSLASQEPNSWSEELGYYYSPQKSYAGEAQLPLTPRNEKPIDITGTTKTEVAKPMSDDVAATASASAPIDDTKIQELMQKYNVMKQLQQPQQMPSNLSSPISTEVKPAPMSLSTALLGLLPVGVDVATGGRGAGLKVAGKYWEDETAKIEANKKSLEKSLMELEKARQIASMKYAAKGAGKSNLELKEVDVNGEPIFIPEEAAIGEKAWKKPAKGTTPKDFEAELNQFKAKQEFLYGLKKDLQKGELDDKKKTDIAKLEDALSRDWTKDKITTTTREMSAAYKQLVSIDPYAKDPMKDLGVVFNYMKFLDPASTVRESEQALVLGAKTYGDFISNMQDILTRKIKLTPSQIKNIQKFVAMNYLERLGTQKSITDSQYLEKAKKRGLDPSMVVGKTSVGVPMYVKVGNQWTIKNIAEEDVEREKARGSLPIDSAISDSSEEVMPTERINRAMPSRPTSPSPVSSKRPTFEEWKASKGL